MEKLNRLEHIRMAFRWYEREHHLINNFKVRNENDINRFNIHFILMESSRDILNTHFNNCLMLDSANV